MKILNITSYSPEAFTTKDWVTATTALGLILNLEGLPSNETLFQLIAGFDITGSSDLIYTLFFVDGYSVVTQGGVYRAKVLLPYEIANMYLHTVSSAPPFYPKNRSWAVTIVALQGEITYFRLDTLAFQYSLEGPPNVTKLDPNLIRTSLDIYLLLLLVIPIDTVIILQWFSKHET